jgi:hypothetical protein
MSSRSSYRSPGKSPAKTNQLHQIQRALATSKEAESGKTLIRGGMTGVAVKAKEAQVIAAFVAVKGWKLIDKSKEPPWVGLPADYNPSEPVETVFSDPHKINVDQVVTDRLLVLQGKVTTCFDTLLNAIQPPTPLPHDPATGTPITANDVLRRTAEVQAGRAAAVLSTELKEDDIRSHAEDREKNRRTSEKNYEQVVADTLAVFYQVFSHELLSFYSVDLKAGRYRKVYYNLMASLDGSRIGTDNTLVVMTELTNYVYASEATMMDNVQYMNILCETAGLDDSQKLVLFLNGLDRAPNVHGELRATAAQFRRDNKSWDVISAALCDSYNVLLTAGKISQDTKSSSSSTEHSAHVAELRQKIKSLEKERAGGKRARVQAAAANAANAAFTGPGRGAKAAKTKDDRFCDHCKAKGHTDADCYKLHPCPVCGSTTHGAWNHDRAVAKEAEASTPASPGTTSLTSQFKKM